MRISLWPKALILCGGVLALTLYFSKGNLKEDWRDFTKAIAIHIDNLSYSVNPERAKSVTAIEKEESLKSFVGDPFIHFSRQDWIEFWNILYGVYPLDYPENKRLPPMVRQFTALEMEDKLRALYPRPFAYFKDEHWRQFWGIVFGKKAKQQ